MLQIAVLDSSGTRRFATKRCELQIGKRPGIDLVISDVEAARTHCVLQVVRDAVRLVDFGSEHGTKVRGERISEAMLRAGDEFSIGRTRFKVLGFSTATGAAARTAAPAKRPQKAAAPAKPAPARPASPAAAAAGRTIQAPVPTGGPAQGDFGREIRLMLSKAPWYAVSLVIHILALMLLDFVDFEVRRPVVQQQLEVANQDTIDLPESSELEDPDFADFQPDEALLEEELEEPEPPPEEIQDKPPAPVDEGDAPILPELGAGRGIPGPHRLIRPLQRKVKHPGAAKAVDRTNLEGEHSDAAEVIRQTVGGRGIPRGIPSTRILIVEGEFDKMEKVLDLYRIRYTLVSREEMMRKNYPQARLLCINCGRRPSSTQRAKLVGRVKSFVQRGGWLITSDWSVDPYLTMGFPDRVKRVQPRRRQSDTTVTVEPGPATSPILQGVFGRHAESSWWLEETSTFFKATPGRTNILVVSAEMEKRYGSGTVAFDFTVNRGRVVHLLGHFYQKDGNRMGLVGMHRLIINLIRERFPSH